jgi:centrosomal protein CEP164
MSAGDSVVLEEELPENYEPTEDEILEYASWLGMDVDQEKELFWIAREGLKAPLPEHWKPCKTNEGEIYYFNFATGDSVWDHPCDAYYKNLYADEKKKFQDGKKSSAAAKEKKKRKQQPGTTAQAAVSSGSATAASSPAVVPAATSKVALGVEPTVASKTAAGVAALASTLGSMKKPVLGSSSAAASAATSSKEQPVSSSVNAPTSGATGTLVPAVVHSDVNTSIASNVSRSAAPLASATPLAEDVQMQRQSLRDMKLQKGKLSPDAGESAFLTAPAESTMESTILGGATSSSDEGRSARLAQTETERRQMEMELQVFIQEERKMAERKAADTVAQAREAFAQQSRAEIAAIEQEQAAHAKRMKELRESMAADLAKQSHIPSSGFSPTLLGSTNTAESLRMQSEHRQQLLDMQSQHLAAIASTRTEHDEGLRRMKVAHEELLAEQRSRTDAEIARLQDELQHRRRTLELEEQGLRARQDVVHRSSMELQSRTAEEEARANAQKFAAEEEHRISSERITRLRAQLAEEQQSLQAQIDETQRKKELFKSELASAQAQHALALRQLASDDATSEALSAQKSVINERFVQQIKEFTALEEKKLAEHRASVLQSHQQALAKLMEDSNREFMNAASSRQTAVSHAAPANDAALEELQRRRVDDLRSRYESDLRREEDALRRRTDDDLRIQKQREETSAEEKLRQYRREVDERIDLHRRREEARFQEACDAVKKEVRDRLAAVEDLGRIEMEKRRAELKSELAKLEETSRARVSSARASSRTVSAQAAAGGGGGRRGASPLARDPLVPDAENMGSAAHFDGAGGDDLPEPLRSAFEFIKTQKLDIQTRYKALMQARAAFKKERSALSESRGADAEQRRKFLSAVKSSLNQQAANLNVDIERLQKVERWLKDAQRAGNDSDNSSQRLTLSSEASTDTLDKIGSSVAAAFASLGELEKASRRRKHHSPSADSMLESIHYPALPRGMSHGGSRARRPQWMYVMPVAPHDDDDFGEVAASSDAAVHRAGLHSKVTHVSTAFPFPLCSLVTPTLQLGPAGSGVDWRLSALQRQLLKWATDRQVHFKCGQERFLID